MTVSTAKIQDWRVSWVAVTNRHPGLLDKTPFEQRVVLFKQFVEEDPQLIRAFRFKYRRGTTLTPPPARPGLFLGQDYFPMLRNHPKPLPPVKPVNATGNATTNSTASATKKEADADKKKKKPTNE